MPHLLGFIPCIGKEVFLSCQVRFPWLEHACGMLKPGLYFTCKPKFPSTSAYSRCGTTAPAPQPVQSGTGRILPPLSAGKEGQRQPGAAGPGAVPDSLMLVPGPPGIKSFMQCLEGGSL